MVKSPAKRLLNKLLGLMGGVVLLLILAILISPLPKKEDWSYSTVILDDAGDYLRVYLDKNQQWHLRYTGEIPTKLKTSLLEFEDKKFYSHPGINLLAIGRAFYTNIKAGRVVSGGSTITMQTARLFLNKERTLLNKLQEAFIALKLELYYSKDEILLMYLNNAPYGSNIVGIRSAAYKYYGKELEELTWAEAALFAVLPNNPSNLFPGRNSDKLKEKRDRLLHKLMLAGYLDAQQYKYSIRETIPKSQYSFPFIAPHLGDRLRKGPELEYNTCISREIQEKVESIAEKEGAYLTSMGIKNMAILVSKTKTHEVKAYLGSQAYFSQTNNGFVDGVQALRSSGSILKPFIYGYALEKGIITPNSLLEDVNKNFGILLPKNYDKKYRGISTAREALQKSLNIPAYEVTQKIGVYNAVSVLKSVGMKSLFREASAYGLSICIGGAEANLWELSEMYQSLANAGLYSNLKLTSQDIVNTHQSLLSPASSYLTLEILQGVKKPNPFINKFPNFAWKTGTSNGFRDAWAVGLDQEWTIAVWAGNFTGEGNPHLSGREIAGTILFRVLDALPNNENPFFTKPWADFKQIPVCAVSGYSPTKNCLDTLWVDVPKDIFVLPKCPYHKQITVNLAETMQVCSQCWQGIAHKSISVLDYPPNVDYYLKQEEVEFPQIPQHNPECSQIKANSDLIVKYPIANSIIYLPTDINGKLNSFQAEAYSADSLIYWFLDDVFLTQTSSKHKVDIKAKPGKKELFLMTSEGATQKVNFVIQVKED
jgi:penicillin-binding protein 1C